MVNCLQEDMKVVCSGLEAFALQRIEELLYRIQMEEG